MNMNEEFYPDFEVEDDKNEDGDRVQVLIPKEYRETLQEKCYIDNLGEEDEIQTD